jgi:tetratricopeptide (TPR) repeat protein
MEDALADAQVSARLAGARPRVLMTAADALDAAGDAEGARAAFRRALHLLSSGRGGTLRVELLSRLARLEERQGRLGDALRAWREILMNDPAHLEARRGVERLTAGAP